MIDSNIIQKKKYKISVAMTVYNGERYLKKQLISIFNQTIKPDELIVCDDGSTDNSKKIFDSFVDSYQLHGKWKYIINEKNKGFSRNFLDCAMMCTGDIIFFSDQDDIWLAHKIRKMVNVFYNNPVAKVVCCSYNVINDQDTIVKTHINLMGSNSKRIERMNFEQQVRRVKSPGLCLAFKKECLQDVYKAVQQFGCDYDLPFGLIYSAKRSFYYLHEQLVMHRVHNSNTSSPSFSFKKLTDNCSRYILGRRKQLQLLEMSNILCEDSLTAKQKKKLKKEMRHRKKAISALESKSLYILFLQLFRIGKMDNKAIDVGNFVTVAKCKFR